MSRSHKEQRALRERASARAYVASFNEVDGESTSPEAVSFFMRERDERARSLRKHGPSEDQRYGNQRKMRARCDKAARRADRRAHLDPHLDEDGELGLEARPASPSRRRGPRWS